MNTRFPEGTHRFNNINKELIGLVEHLNKKYMISKEEEKELQLTQQRNIMNEYFVERTDDGPIYPYHIFRDLREEAFKQSGALESFSTDLAGNIEIATQNAFSNGIVPLLEEIKHGIDQFNQNQKQSTNEFFNEFIDSINNSFQELVDNFHRSLSGSTMSQLETMAEIVGETGSTLSSLPGKLDTMFINFEKTLKSLDNSISESSTKASEEAAASTELMREHVDNVLTKFNEGMQDTNRNTFEIINQQNEIVQNIVHELIDLQDSQKKNSILIDEQIKQTISVLEEGKTLTNKNNQVLNTMRNMLVEVNQTTNQLADTSESLAESGKGLGEVTNQLSIASDNYLSENAKILDKINELFDTAGDTVTNYSEKFGIIESGLVGIFEKIQDGLFSYQDTTRTSINDYLSEFNTQLANATHSIKGSVEGLEETFEELNDSLNNLLQ